MPKKLIFLSVLVAFIVTLGALLFVNKDHILTFYKNFKPTSANFNKLIITQDELNESLELEKLLQTADEAQAIATAHSKVRYAGNQQLEGLAEGRVTRRKILEKEGQKSGLNIDQIKKESLPVWITRGGIKFTATTSAQLYSYDENLQKAVKEKVEGYVEKQVLSVIFQSAKVATIAQKIADDVLTLMQKGDFNSQNYLKDHPLDKGLSLYDRIIRDPLKAYPEPAKLPVIGQIKITPTPYSFDVEKITKIEKGLGVSFEEWYGKVKNSYHE